MHIRFCVVPSAQAEEIAAIAREFAELDPNARRVIVAGEDDYPAEPISVAIARFDRPGAVVLTRAGAVFRVLDIDDARNGGIVDRCFAEARLA